ncbi:MAG: phospholipase [Paludibacteraceae bacterium]|nr:phospholipase [Paludibacteraceae bacterium]
MIRVVIVLSLFAITGIIAIVGTEIRERRRRKRLANGEELAEPSQECCGQHLVCERESLLNSSAEIEYYDDEELDALANRSGDDYDESELKMFEDVFYSLREEDVAGWCRSLQLRSIELPEQIRDAALLIVRERRSSKL